MREQRDAFSLSPCRPRFDAASSRPACMNLCRRRARRMYSSAADRARSATSLRPPLVFGGIGCRADHRVLRPVGQRWRSVTEVPYAVWLAVASVCG
jgi:hypothetical protein